MAEYEFPEDQYDEPEPPPRYIRPMPEPIPGVNPSPGIINPPSGITTPGAPAAPSAAWQPGPTELEETGEGNVRTERGQIITPIRKRLLGETSVDAYVGVVLKTYYSGAHPTLGTAQGIDVERIDVRWDSTTNKPLTSVTPSPKLGSENVVACNPWPAAHDQELYQVEEGDIVTVFRGANGLNWFLYDNNTTPFVGVVVDWDDDTVTENVNGGTHVPTPGTLTQGLKVRQQSITGDATAVRAFWLTLRRSQTLGLRIQNT